MIKSGIGGGNKFLLTEIAKRTNVIYNISYYEYI